MTKPIQKQISKNHVKAAVCAAGGVEAVAKVLGVTKPAIYHWINSGRVPSERVVDLCDLTGGFIKASQLRPDVFKGDYAGV